MYTQWSYSHIVTIFSLSNGVIQELISSVMIHVMMWIYEETVDSFIGLKKNLYANSIMVCSRWYILFFYGSRIYKNKTLLKYFQHRTFSYIKCFLKIMGLMSYFLFVCSLFIPYKEHIGGYLTANRNVYPYVSKHVSK